MHSGFSARKSAEAVIFALRQVQETSCDESDLYILYPWTWIKHLMGSSCMSVVNSVIREMTGRMQRSKKADVSQVSSCPELESKIVQPILFYFWPLTATIHYMFVLHHTFIYHSY